MVTNILLASLIAITFSCFLMLKKAVETMLSQLETLRVIYIIVQEIRKNDEK